MPLTLDGYLSDEFRVRDFPGPPAQATRHSSYTRRLVERYLARGMEPAGRLVVISCRAGIEPVARTPKTTGTCYGRRTL